jgi:vancomycin permeability regulator SanA
MLRKMLIWLFRIVLLIVGVVLLAILLPRIFTSLFAYPRSYETTEVPETPVAIIFGAGLRRDVSPTAVLRDRVNKGVELYLSGKVHKLLMSGDNRSEFYDEPTAMQDYAVALGVPQEDIILDYAGLRTYDTCYRAKAIFGLRQATLVTQGFHLPRALYTCNALGIDAVGVAADRYRYLPGSMAIWNIRETLATVIALFDVHVTRPVPVLGQPEPIFPPEI